MKAKKRSQNRKRTARNKKGTVEPMRVIFLTLDDSVPKLQESRTTMDRWQTSPVSARTSNHSMTCGDLMTMAQRELSAFIRAVTELFGSEQARLSAEDWLDE